MAAAQMNLDSCIAAAFRLLDDLALTLNGRNESSKMKKKFMQKNNEMKAKDSLE